MKSFLVLNLAFLITASFASANVVTVIETATQVVTKTRVGNASILKGISSSAALSAGANSAVMSKIESLGASIEAISSSNVDDLNGLTKAERVDNLLRTLKALVNFSSNEAIVKLAEGDFLKMSTVEVNPVIASAQFAKLTNFFSLIEAPGVDLEQAVKTATGNKSATLAEFANACGAQSRR